MGIFKTKEEREEMRQAFRDKQAAKADGRSARAVAARDKFEGKSREKAAKKGIDVDGAVLVLGGFDDGAEQTLVVWPRRVDLHNHGKIGSLTAKGKGIESMPIANVASVQAASDGIWCKLEVHGSGNSLTAKLNQAVGPHAREVILELVQAAKSPATGTAATNPEAAMSPVEHIKQLAELRDAGIITAEEFEAKKIELLGRL